MKSRRKPPALAQWLLEHSGSGPDDRALEGDLLEELNFGRSAGWYWRQVVIAMVQNSARVVRRDPGMAMRAIAVSWAVNYGAMLAGRRLFLRDPSMGPAVATVALGLFGGFCGGLAVALLQRKERKPLLSLCAAALPVWSFVAVLVLKKDALQHSIGQIGAATAIYGILALAGFLTGGLAGPRLARAPSAKN